MTLTFVIQTIFAVAVRSAVPVPLQTLAIQLDAPRVLAVAPSRLLVSGRVLKPVARAEFLAFKHIVQIVDRLVISGILCVFAHKRNWFGPGAQSTHSVCFAHLVGENVLGLPGHSHLDS